MMKFSILQTPIIHSSFASKPLLSLQKADSFQKSADAVSFKGAFDTSIREVGKDLLRGREPASINDLQTLLKKGVNTIVSLEPISESLEKEASKLGLKVLDRSDESSQTFNETLNILNDEKYGKKYLHCMLGVHRTGLTVMAHRLSNDASLESAYNEYGKVVKESNMFLHSKDAIKTELFRLMGIK